MRGALDAGCVVAEGRILKTTKRLGANPVAFSHLCLLLNEKAHSRQQLIDTVGVTEATMQRWLKILRNRELIFVYTWLRLRHHHVPFFAWGYRMPDAQKPATKIKRKS